MTHSAPRLRHLVPAVLALAVPLAAEDAPVAATGTTLVVVGETQADAINLPGTATVLDREVLEMHRYQNVQQSLRLSPGVNAVDEDGYGMRMNVGLRGVRAPRSTKVLMLEDGIPLAPNPYNDPGLYMGPAYARFPSVEIVKGSGQILYGPHTVAGLINFKSRTPSFEGGGRVDVAVDSFNGYRGLVQADAPLAENVVLATDIYVLDTDGFRRFDHVSQIDVSPRLIWNYNEAHSFEFRLSHTGEQSNLTYQGLSRDDFAANPYDRYDFTSRDHFDGERTALAARHAWDMDEFGSLLSTLYTQLTDRTWDRGEQLFDAGSGSYVGTTRTTAGVERDASARDRRYYHGGLEIRWNNTYDLGGVTTVIDAGTRAHFEGQNNATRDHEVDTGNYLTRQVDVRDTMAGAVWAQAAFGVGAGVTIIPGVRAEGVHVTSQRQVTNYVEVNNPEGASTTIEVMPGLGLTYDATESLQFYGGVHRGFSPPSYSQAVSSSGEDQELDAELSWNFEVGARTTIAGIAMIDAALFYVDYENIIAQGIANGPQINGGEAVHSGAELLVESDLLAGNAGDLRAPVRLALTYVEAEYASDVYSGATLVANDGNSMEFAPEVTLSLSAGIEGFGPRQGFGVMLTATYIGEQYSDGLNTEAVTADGSTGLIDDVLLLDFAGRWKPQGEVYELYVGLQNLTDEEYVAYRRGGQGSVAGAPLKAIAGIAANF